MVWTLDQLRVAEAVARTRSFSGAAAALHKVPSAVSYSVAALEEALGFAVFARTRPVRPTPEGRAVLTLAEEVLAASSRLDRAAEDFRGGWEPELRVVVDGALPLESVLRCVRRFGAPDVPTTLVLDVEHQEGVIERFLAGADLALVLGLEDDGDQTVRLRPLPPLPMVLVAARSHPLAAGPAHAEARDRHPELLVRDSARRYDEGTRASFLGSANRVHLSDFHSKRLALLSGAGYGWVPEHLVADDLDAGELAVLDAEPARWTYRPCLVSRANRAPGRAEALFVSTLLTDSTEPVTEE